MKHLLLQQVLHSGATGKHSNRSGRALWIVSQTTSRLISK